MLSKTIEKMIEIQSTPTKVWQVLLEDETYRVWTATFIEGSHVETDWQVGSLAYFKDGGGSGLIAKVLEHEPHEYILMEYVGEISKDGVEDFSGSQPGSMNGGQESYRLITVDNGVRLEIKSDMGEEYFESMSAAWDEALLKIKELTEKDQHTKLEIDL